MINLFKLRFMKCNWTDIGVSGAMHPRALVDSVSQMCEHNSSTGKTYNS